MSIRRVLAVVAVIGMTVAVGVGSAAASGPRIAPNQEFVGLVNGSTGQHAPAQIKVACPGPAQGQTTHPLPHQSLEVSLPASTGGTVGHTGPRARRISTFLGIPPSGTATGGGLPTFTHYGNKKPIPTSLTVPCSGSGYITFIPFPRVPGKTVAFVVPVDYVNVAA
jgi:hypothetical protein